MFEPHMYFAYALIRIWDTQSVLIRHATTVVKTLKMLEMACDIQNGHEVYGTKEQDTTP